MYVRVGKIYQFQYGLTRSKYQKCWRSEKRRNKRRNKTKAKKHSLLASGYGNELSSLSRRKKLRDLWSSSGGI